MTSIPETATPEAKRLSEREFIALVAMLFATIAFSIDAMLPALSTIGAELSPEAPSRAALVVGIFVFGLGLGTLITGPLSDAVGRKRVILSAYVLFIAGAIIAGTAPTLEIMLAGRFLQGLAAAGPRIAALAMVRDLYNGPKMAAIMSMTMVIFGLIPAIAPLLGQTIMLGFGWRAIFFAFALFALAASLWLWSRQPETLPPEDRNPMRIATLWAAMKMALSNRVFRFAVAVQTMIYGALFSQISAIQPVFEISYDRGESFPLWFGAMAILSMSASFINSRIVARFGMRRIIITALTVQGIFSAVVLAAILIGGSLPFAVFYVWATSVMFLVGFTLGNLNALAMEPMGKIAGLAASISGSISTVLSAVIAMPISLSFDGTPRALVEGVLVCVVIAFGLMKWLGPRRATDMS